MTYSVRTRKSPARVTGTLPSVYGIGTAFPIAFTTTGGVAYASGVDYVEQCIRHAILSMELEGVRVFDVSNGAPYGTKLSKYKFMPLPQLESAAGYEIRRAVDLWVPQAVVTGVKVSAAGTTEEDRRTAQIHVTYKLRFTSVERTVTVGF